MHFGSLKSVCRALVIAGIIVLTLNSAQANQDLYRVGESGLTRDLGQNTILSIIQSEAGFLWFATQGGVARYDGQKIVSFNHWTDGAGTNRSLNPTELFSGPNGSVFLATYGAGLLKFNETRRQFEAAFTATLYEKIEKNISAAIVDQHGTIWLGHESGLIQSVPIDALSVVNHSTGRKTRVSDLFSNGRKSIYAVFEAGDFALLARGTESNDPADNSALCGLGDARVEEALGIHGRIIYIGTRGSGLFELDMEERACRRILLPSSATKDSIHATIHDLKHIESKDEVWVSSDQGFYILKNSSVIQHFNTANSSISDDEVTFALHLNDSISWIGTYSGLSVLINSSFELHNETQDQRLSSVVAISSSIELGSWMATYDDLLYFDEQKEKHFSFSEVFPTAQLDTSRIMSLLVEADSIWLGHRSLGLQRFYPSTDQTLVLNTKTEPALSSNAVSSFLRVNESLVLVGTYGGGLNAIISESDVVQHLPDGNSGSIIDSRVIDLFMDQSGKIWVATEGGLQLFDHQSNEFSNAPIASGLISADLLIWSVAEDAYSRIWLGTARNGLLRVGDNAEIQAVEGQLSRFSTIYSLETDESGNLWASTNNGLIRRDPQGDYVSFGIRHGLQGREFEFNASHQDHKGRIYFGGSNGYNRFDPDSISTDDKPPPVVLTDLEIAGETPALNVSLQDLSEIELGYRDYYVTFVFSALDYLDPYNNLYRHKLIGFDPKWVELGNRNSATYTNLPAGDYTLHIQGASAAGIWNREGLKLQLRVLPAPWFSWWAWCIYLSLAVVALWHARKTYDNYLIRTRAIRLAEEMQIAADRAADEAQEQLDDQARLVDTIHRFNLQKLGLIGECLSRYAERLPDDMQREFLAGHGRRVVALQQLEGSLFYRHDELLANMRAYTDSLIEAILPSAAISPEKIIVINGVTEDLLPGRYALPLAVMLFELLANAMDHAFEDSNHSCVVNVQLDRHGASEDAAEHWLLVVEDNGVSMPENISLQAPETEGFASLLAAASLVEGRVSRVPAAGTRIEVEIPLVEEADVEEGT